MIARAAILAAILAAQPALAAEPAAKPGAAPVDRSQEIVCRRDVETGSLVKAKKTCHTRAQWQYIDDMNQQFGRQLVDDIRRRPGSN